MLEKKSSTKNISFFFPVLSLYCFAFPTVNYDNLTNDAERSTANWC